MKCSACGAGFATKKFLANHLAQSPRCVKACPITAVAPGKPATFACRTCKKSFLTHAMLMSHLSASPSCKHLGDGLSLNEPGDTFRCYACAQVFSSKTLLQAHLKSSASCKMGEAACKICGIAFALGLSLHQHLLQQPACAFRKPGDKLGAFIASHTLGYPAPVTAKRVVLLFDDAQLSISCAAFIETATFLQKLLTTQRRDDVITPLSFCNVVSPVSAGGCGAGESDGVADRASVSVVSAIDAAIALLAPPEAAAESAMGVRYELVVVTGNPADGDTPALKALHAVIEGMKASTLPTFMLTLIGVDVSYKGFTALRKVLDGGLGFAYAVANNRNALPLVFNMLHKRIMTRQATVTPPVAPA